MFGSLVWIKLIQLLSKWIKSCTGSHKQLINYGKIREGFNKKIQLWGKKTFKKKKKINDSLF